ncbi:hypothetical protein ACRC7T_13335 [Segnochrobactraceae bacterium EtOH-i3]
MSAGSVIWQSARNLVDSARNLDALWETIVSELIGNKYDVRLEENGTENKVACSSWTNPVWSMYFNHFASKRRNSRICGSITITFQLTCDIEDSEIEWKYGRTAKLIAAYSPRPDDWFLFDIASPDSSGIFTDSVTNGPRWELTEDPSQWFFAVPLDSLTSPTAVQRLVVTPLLRMIAGEDARVVFSGLESEICMPPAPEEPSA